jgi:predicted nucleotidyltransferase component of viral defense system
MKYTNKDIHSKIIDDFLLFLNQNTDRFILKGGTALAKCYGLDRFSEDIDLDTNRGNITNIVKNYCAVRKFEYSEKKNTNFGQRFMINYHVDGQLLKIETRMDSKIYTNDICRINKIVTYKINYLAIMKLEAYNERDKIRDMYDVSFIIINH